MDLTLFNNGQWHYISLSVTPSLIQVAIDGILFDECVVSVPNPSQMKVSNLIRVGMNDPEAGYSLTI
jgi:hypothetical protein